LVLDKPDMVVGVVCCKWVAVSNTQWLSLRGNPTQCMQAKVSVVTTATKRNKSPLCNFLRHISQNLMFTSVLVLESSNRIFVPRTLQSLATAGSSSTHHKSNSEFRNHILPHITYMLHLQRETRFHTRIEQVGRLKYLNFFYVSGFRC